MRLAKTLLASLFVILIVGTLWGFVVVHRASSSVAGEVVKDLGCVRQGVEGGCLILKTFDGKKTYNLLFSDGKKPAVGAAISFEGTKHDGPTICMQGIAVDVLKWTNIKRRCPTEPGDEK